MIRILIADNHAIIRNGLKLMIAEEDDMTVKGEAENGKQVFEKLKTNKFDILILDLSMPDLNGMEILKSVKELYPKLPILILSALPEEPYAINLIKSGAKGYLNKIAASEQLIDAIKTVISGKLYINPALSYKLVSLLQDDYHLTLHDSLTELELEIMLLLASEKTVKSISNKLLMSINSIYRYRKIILQKMKMTKDSELIQYCIKNGLLLS